MSQRLIAFLLATCIALAPLAAQANSYNQNAKADPYYQVLLDTSKTKHGRALIDFLDQQVQQDASRIAVIAVWLRDNSIGQKNVDKIDSLYFLSYADTLGSMAEGYRAGSDPGKFRDLLETSILNLYIFELMASVDAARCQDPTVIMAVKSVVQQRLAAIQDSYRMFPKKDFEMIEKSAIAEEDKTADRPANLDVCAMGQVAVRDLLKTKGVVETKVPDTRYRNSQRTVLVPPAGYVFIPSLVTDTEWQAARPKMLDTVTTDWAQRYDTLSR